MAPKRNIKLASFDGGGARVFSQLEIMKQIMHRMRWDKYPDDHEKVMLPCEHFDLMGGSDTGGLIAIMFAKLRMSVEEVILEFGTIVNEVYVKGLEPAERTNRLRRYTEQLLDKRGLLPDAKLQSAGQERGCLGFVLASHSVNVRHKVYLRTYPVRHQASSSITIVDAVLATCASQPEFLPVTIGSGILKQEYIGADLGASNPVRQVIAEAHSHFEAGTDITLLLSLGSGHPGVFALSPNGGNDALYRLMQELIIDSQQRAQEVQERMNHVGAYFRFSVEQGMQRNQHGDSEELGWIAAQTDSYLSTPEMTKKIDDCVERLSAQFGDLSLDQLNGIASPNPVRIETRPVLQNILTGVDVESFQPLNNEKARLYSRATTSPYNERGASLETSSSASNEQQNTPIISSSNSPISRSSTIQNHFTNSESEMTVREEKVRLLGPRSNPNRHYGPLLSPVSPNANGKGRENIVEPSPISAGPPSSILRGNNPTTPKGSSVPDTRPPQISDKRRLSRQTFGIQSQHGGASGHTPPNVVERSPESSSDSQLENLDDLERSAWTLYSQRRYSEAESLQSQVLKGWTAHAGEQDLRTLRCMFSLATTQYQLGRYSEASQLFLKVWEGRKRLVGDGDAKTLDAMCNLAWSYYHDGQLSEAESLFATLKAVRPDVGQAHLMTLTAINDLALTCYQELRYSEAEALFFKVWEGRKANLGESHDKTLDAECHLAWSYYHQGHYLKAEPLFARLRLIRAELCEAHLKTLAAMSDLALSYYRQHRYSEAERIQVLVLNGRKAQLGNKNAKTLEAMCNLAWTYYQQGRESEAEPLYAKIKEVQKELQRANLPQPPSNIPPAMTKIQRDIVTR